ncbi:MAG: EI24 domain-containing protein [Magnetovibrio sp.]|nr:EI24 domain-containing protein [Magnetovibrio sp.]
MGTLLSAYFKGFGQLSDSKTRAVVMRSIAGAIFVFIVLYIALYFALKITAFVSIGWLEIIFDTIAQFGVMALTWLLFPAVVTAVGSFMLNGVVEAVEQRHYPNKPVAPGQTIAESLVPAAKFMAVTVGFNLLLVPLLIIPPLWPILPFIYLGLNGYLISREYFELVALRRISPDDAKAMHERWKTPLLIGGIGFAFMLTIPLLNLIAPVIATAAMVHMFETWRKKDGVVDKPTPTGRNSPPKKQDVISSLDLASTTKAKSRTLSDEDDVMNLSRPDK